MEAKAPSSTAVDQSNANGQLVQEPGRARWLILLGAIALTYLVCAVFFPILGFEFVDVDTPTQVVHNTHIQGLTAENLKHIFTSWCISSYYPVRTLTYAIDYQIWGLNFATFKLINGLELRINGFKLTNGLLHLTNVLLLFWLILRLFRQGGAPHGAIPAWWDAAVAAFSAGIFAVHPVVVQPVAWVPGREELLMTLGALACIHFQLSARRLGEAGGKPRWALACYACAAFSCAAACLSNAVAAVIPMLIVAWDVLMLPQPKLWRIVSGTAALWATGVATIVIKKLGPRSYPHLVGELAGLTAVLDRLGTSGAAAAEQLGAFSPQRLMLVLNVYWLNLKTLVWPTDLTIHYVDRTPGSFLDAGVILGSVAIGLTCVILWKLRRRRLVLYGLLWFGLALGPSSQILAHQIHRADRFLYLPLVGLAVAASLGLRPLKRALRTRARVAGVIAAGLLGLLLLDTLSARQVQTWRDSVSLWEHCVEVVPNNTAAHLRLAENLAIRGQVRRAVEHYDIAMRLDPSFIESFVKSLNKLALELATCQEEKLRNYELAVRLAERACRLTQHSSPDDLGILAEVYARAGRFDSAVATVERAIQLAQAAGNAELVAELQRQLKLYQNRTADLQTP